MIAERLRVPVESGWGQGRNGKMLLYANCGNSKILGTLWVQIRLRLAPDPYGVHELARGVHSGMKL